MARQRQHQSRRESRDAREQHVCVCRACGNRHVARGARASSDVAREFRALFEEPARKSEWVSWRVLARFGAKYRLDRRPFVARGTGVHVFSGQGDMAKSALIC